MEHASTRPAAHPISEQRQVIHRICLAVECPGCGAEPDQECRSSKPSRNGQRAAKSTHCYRRWLEAGRP